MRHFLGLALLALAGCTRPVEVSPISSSTDYSGLADYERSQFDWAAVEVSLPASVARSIRRWELGSTHLNLFRCNEPDDRYPAPATLAGDLFDYRNIPHPVGDGVTLTFYVPKHVQENGRYDCAALDARGYSPVFLRSQTLRLPPLKFASFKSASRETPPPSTE